SVLCLSCILHIISPLIDLIALGAQDVQTVSQVSVQERRSIVIPCWYNRAYVNNVKYLSFGDHWTFSKYIEFSDGREKHETVSVSDNKSTSIVSINMRNIQQSQSGTYWCAIDGPRAHIQNGFSIAGLYVQDQMLAGFEGGSVTVACYYHLPRKTGIKWCKLAGNCVLEPGGLLDGASVELRNSNGVVSVSVSRLKKENTGWYWCSVRELQMPVHITVSTREETSARTPETTSSQPPVSARDAKLDIVFSSDCRYQSLSICFSLFGSCENAIVELFLCSSRKWEHKNKYLM
uniref:Ig-like domain-containing protein n=1 Tax=Sinocyclocheilus grahami TaxID=75366 RepID=A0A672NB91_SINGR